MYLAMPPSAVSCAQCSLAGPISMRMPKLRAAAARREACRNNLINWHQKIMYNARWLSGSAESRRSRPQALVLFVYIRLRSKLRVNLNLLSEATPALDRRVEVSQRIFRVHTCEFCEGQGRRRGRGDVSQARLGNGGSGVPTIEGVLKCISILSSKSKLMCSKALTNTGSGGTRVEA